MDDGVKLYLKKKKFSIKKIKWEIILHIWLFYGIYTHTPNKEYIV